MSVIFIAIPFFLGPWAAVAAAIGGAGALVGWVLVEGETHGKVEAAEQTGTINEVTLVEAAEGSAAGLERGESMTLSRGGMTARFHRDGRGRLLVHISGAGKTDAELEAAGQELLNQVRQQFAYQKVMDELETRGFGVVEEEVDEQGAIHVRLQRWA